MMKFLLAAVAAVQLVIELTATHCLLHGSVVQTLRAPKKAS